jgi:hypothetical protein
MVPGAPFLDLDASYSDKPPRVLSLQLVNQPVYDTRGSRHFLCPHERLARPELEA